MLTTLSKVPWWQKARLAGLDSGYVRSIGILSCRFSTIYELGPKRFETS